MGRIARADLRVFRLEEGVIELPPDPDRKKGRKQGVYLLCLSVYKRSDVISVALPRDREGEVARVLAMFGAELDTIINMERRIWPLSHQRSMEGMRSFIRAYVRERLVRLHVNPTGFDAQIVYLDSIAPYQSSGDEFPDPSTF